MSVSLMIISWACWFFRYSLCVFLERKKPHLEDKMLRWGH